MLITILLNRYKILQVKQKQWQHKSGRFRLSLQKQWQHKSGRLVASVCITSTGEETM